MPRKAIAYIISDIDKALEFEWVAERLDRARFDLSFYLMNPGDSELERFVKRLGLPCHRIPYKGKRDIPRSICSIYSGLKAFPVEIVHAHLMDACLAGLPAACAAGIPTRIYTRHHATQHFTYNPHAVLYDFLVNWMATDIIAISKNVQRTLESMEFVSPKKIRVINHGLDLKVFLNHNSGNVAALRKRYNPENRSPVIGVISRYVHWKGVQYIIPAFKRILSAFPNALLILANAKVGDHSAEIARLLSELPERSFIEIEFEPDVASLYRQFDLFVHAPIDNHSEAFGQIYIETLAAGIPSILTISGIAEEVIEDRRNALVVPHQDSDRIWNAMKALLGDSDLRARLSKQGQADVVSRFSIETKVKALEDLYASKSCSIAA